MQCSYTFVTFLIYLFCSFLFVVLLAVISFFIQASIFCDVDTGDNNFDIYMVSQILISLRPYLKQK